MKFKFPLVLLLMLIMPPFLSAQQYIYKHFTTADGLPSSEIYHVFQDSKGYIWFATDNGVSRYNGYEFENFGVNEGLSAASISEIYEDYRGRIWFIAMNRTLSYLENAKIAKYKFNEKLLSLYKTGHVPLKLSFYVDSLDKIFIGIASKALFSLDNKGIIKKIDNTDRGLTIYTQFFPKKVLSCFVSHHDSIATLEIFNNNNDTFYNFPFFKELMPQHAFSIKFNDNSYLASIEKYIFKINRGKISILKNPKKHIQYLVSDSRNQIWVCYRNGGVDLYKDSVMDETEKLHFFDDKNISSVLQDRNNGLWFTTLNSGVYYIPSTNTRWMKISDGLESDNITSLASDKNSMWVGYNLPTITKISSKLGISEKIRLQNIDGIQAIYNDTSSKELYLATPDWIYTINEKREVKIIKNTYSNVDMHPTAPQRFNAVDFKKSKNLLWACGGIGFYCIKNYQVIFDSWIDKGFSMRTSKLWIEDSTIWIGSERGLWKYTNDKLEFMGDKDPLLKVRILDIIKKGKNIIIATKGSGIFIYNGKQVKKITQEDGLNNNTITCMYLSNSVLWSGSLNGLNKTKLKLRNDNIEPLITTQIPELNEFELRQILNKNDTLYLATNKGLVIYNTNKKNEINNATPIYITQIKVNNKELPISSKYKLDNHDNNLQINFEALFFKDPNSLKYRYKLIGLDNDWIYTKSREARYYYIPPGKYSFEVEISNRRGQKSKNIAKITLEIIPSIWQTNYFKISLAITILSILLLIFKVTILSAKNKALLRKSMYSYMMQALVGQMNPHFIFNTLNSINNYILNNDKRAASKYLTKFSKLIRRILENSRNEYISLAEEINALELYLEIEALRLKNKFEYSIEYNQDINIFEIKLPSLLIQPFIENSIWHGIQPSTKQGFIKIKISRNNQSLIFDITDNGIGRAKVPYYEVNTTGKKKSLGSEITANRLALLSRMLSKKANIVYTDLYEDDKNAGTQVIVTVPLVING